MRALVTGVAGFIGSTVADQLLDQGWSVLGVDCFTPCYGAGTGRPLTPPKAGPRIRSNKTIKP